MVEAGGERKYYPPARFFVASLLLGRTGVACFKLLTVLTAQGLTPSGPLVAYHRRLEPELFDFEVAFPVYGTVVPADRVVPSAVPSGAVAVLVHEGDHWKEGYQTLYPR